MNSTRTIDRREFLVASGVAIGAQCAGTNLLSATPTAAKSVAAIVTVYRQNSHADVLVGKILNGWRQDGGDGPALRLASLYVDQFPEDDLAASLATRHGFPIYQSIAEAVTMGTDRIAVDGVLSIGEHGDSISLIC
jgi:hypothetical protein